MLIQFQDRAKEGEREREFKKKREGGGERERATGASGDQKKLFISKLFPPQQVQ